MKVELVPLVPQQDVVITLTPEEAHILRAIVGGVGGNPGGKDLHARLYNALAVAPGQPLKVLWGGNQLILDLIKER